VIDAKVIIVRPNRTEVGVGAEDGGEDALAARRRCGLSPHELDAPYLAPIDPGMRDARAATRVAECRELGGAADIL